MTEREPSDRLRRSVVEHYERRLQEHGPTARGMDWKDEASQRLRFEVLCDVCDLAGKAVHEIGAGAGHLLDYLRERGIDTSYSGSDLSGEMVEVARRLHPGVPFEQGDATSGDGRHDVLLCSGLFHVKLDGDDAEWETFVRSAVRRMYERCRVAIAFNLMSDQVDYRSDALYYANPGAVLNFCFSELSRHVMLRHDYPLYEYTVYVYRKPRA